MTSCIVRERLRLLALAEGTVEDRRARAGRMAAKGRLGQDTPKAEHSSSQQLPLRRLHSYTGQGDGRRRDPDRELRA